MVTILTDKDMKRYAIVKHGDETDNWKNRADQIHAQQAIENIIIDGYSGFFVFDNDIFSGVISYIIEKKESIYIGNLAVKKQSSGYGTILLQSVIKLANDKNYYIQLIASSKARSFYVHNGFYQSTSDFSHYTYTPNTNTKTLTHKSLFLMGEY